MTPFFFYHNPSFTPRTWKKKRKLVYVPIVALCTASVWSTNGCMDIWFLVQSNVGLCGWSGADEQRSLNLSLRSLPEGSKASAVCFFEGNERTIGGRTTTLRGRFLGWCCPYVPSIHVAGREKTWTMAAEAAATTTNNITNNTNFDFYDQRRLGDDVSPFGIIVRRVNDGQENKCRRRTAAAAVVSTICKISNIRWDLPVPFTPPLVHLSFSDIYVWTHLCWFLTGRLFWPLQWPAPPTVRRSKLSLIRHFLSPEAAPRAFRSWRHRHTDNNKG